MEAIKIKRNPIICIISLLVTLFILPACSDRQQHIDALHRVAPETILSGATDFIIHEANADADIYMFEYSVASADPAAVISTIDKNLNTSWSRDKLTSTGLTVSKTETNKPFWDIQRQIDVFASPAGRVLVLVAGLTPRQKPAISNPKP